MSNVGEVTFVIPSDWLDPESLAASSAGGFGAESEVVPLPSVSVATKMSDLPIVDRLVEPKVVEDRRGVGVGAGVDARDRDRARRHSAPGRTRSSVPDPPPVATATKLPEPSSAATKTSSSPWLATEAVAGPGSKSTVPTNQPATITWPAELTPMPLPIAGAVRAGERVGPDGRAGRGQLQDEDVIDPLPAVRLRAVPEGLKLTVPLKAPVT